MVLKGIVEISKNGFYKRNGDYDELKTLKTWLCYIKTPSSNLDLILDKHQGPG